jgi:hypothetical protein
VLFNTRFLQFLYIYCIYITFKDFTMVTGNGTPLKYAEPQKNCS